MTLKAHIILGGITAGGLSPALGLQDSAVFWASSVLIDTDHYWDYLYRNRFRNWSVRKMFEFHRVLFLKIGRRDFLALNVFHTAECLVLVFLAAAWLGSSAPLAVFLGMVFHLGLDLARLTRCRAPFSRALSVVEYSVRRRALVRRGLDPNRVYQETLVEIGIDAAPRTTLAGATNPVPPWPE